MDEVVARCPDCGMEQVEEFANCFVCLKPSRWWCLVCRDWRPTRACPACGGGVGVPGELFLGSCTVGSTIRFKVAVRNGGKKPVKCEVSSPDPGVAVAITPILIPPAGTTDVRGGITLPPGPLGRRTFRLQFGTPIPCETLLAVEAIPATPRLDFLPTLVLIRMPKPGIMVPTSVALKNTGNVTLTANLSSSASWLKFEPKSVMLPPGESVQVKLLAVSKKTDSGTLEARLTADATGGPYAAVVRYKLPDPELAADPVAFGELKPGRVLVVDVVLRNTGRVRVKCTLAPADPWFRVLPARLNLPAGREKKIRLRAVLSADQDGPQRSELVVSSGASVVFRLPVSAVGKVPRGILRAVRKQRLRDAIGPAVERKFQVANDGDGRLDVQATADKPWVKIVTPELRVAPGKKRKLRYVLDLPNLPRGEHSATISLTSNGGSAEVPVTVHVLDPNPVLEVVPPRHLGMISPSLPLSAFVQVRNAGVGLLTVKAESEDPHVSVTPEEVNVAVGPPVRFNLTIPIQGLPGGEHEVAVRFTSNGGSDRAVVRFRLPVELTDAPTLLALGLRPAGRPIDHAFRVRNVGPDRVTLHVRGEHEWLRPAVEQFGLIPGETVSILFRMELPADLLGPVASSILLEGRALRHTVTVTLVARRMEVVVVPGVVVLGDMRPGEERAFAVELVNAGELPAEVPAIHVSGELEVWVKSTAVKPGQRVTLSGRVRMNSKQFHREIRTAVPLTYLGTPSEATVRVAAKMVPRTWPKLLAVGAAAGSMLAAGLSILATGSWLGIPLASTALLLGLLTTAWVFWLNMD